MIWCSLCFCISSTDLQISLWISFPEQWFVRLWFLLSPWLLIPSPWLQLSDSMTLTVTAISELLLLVSCPLSCFGKQMQCSQKLGTAKSCTASFRHLALVQHSKSRRRRWCQWDGQETNRERNHFAYSFIFHLYLALPTGKNWVSNNK